MFQDMETYGTDGTKKSLDTVKIARFNAFQIQKACAALHAESMLTIGLTLKDKSESLKVLQKQTEKIIGESDSDLCDADFQPDLLSAARKRLG